jgi:hypothetical protein
MAAKKTKRKKRKLPAALKRFQIHTGEKPPRKGSKRAPAPM